MAGGAHADQATVRELRTAITDNARRSSSALESATRGANRVVGQVTTELRVRELEVQRAREALEACEQMKDANCSRQRQALFDATLRRDTARRILARVESARTEYSSIVRRLNQTNEHLTNGGRKYLTEQLHLMGDYSATAGMLSGSAAGSASAEAMASAGQGPAIAGALRPAGLPAGFEMVPLSAIDTSRSSVTSAADFRPDYSPDDLDWAFDALEQVVLPALAAGESPDVFAERDARSGLIGTKSYSMTYSQFLGQFDTITLHPGPNGYTIGNGQHRIWVAQQGGRSSIPARIIL